MKTDVELQKDVIDELAWEPSVDAAKIAVGVESGIVTLNGTVNRLSEKWAAVQAAQRVAGVAAVTDDILVDLPGDAHRTDVDLARAAVNALDWNDSVPPGKIRVVVERGTISLRGDVPYQFQRAAAEQAVGRLVGAKGVVNLISVKPPRISPLDVQQKIQHAFERAARLEGGRISVRAADGKVTLCGSVKTWDDRKQAEQAAWGAPGVSQVENKITVAC